MNRYIDAEWIRNLYADFKDFEGRDDWTTPISNVLAVIDDAPSIDIVFCKECVHRPIKEDADGENYGFNLIEPNDGDERCPCLVSDGWYSWMPEDDFYCGFGEREGE